MIFYTFVLIIQMSFLSALPAANYASAKEVDTGLKIETQVNSQCIPSWDNSSLEFVDGCAVACDKIATQLCNHGDQSMAEPSSYEVWYSVTGNPKFGALVATGAIPVLGKDQCINLEYVPTATGNYKFKAWQRSGHPGLGLLWSESCDVTSVAGCSQPFCGDGIKNGSEECDDGNTVDGDGCSANCTIEQTGPTCGDGFVAGDELCDLGGLNGQLGIICTSQCTWNTEPYCETGEVTAIPENLDEINIGDVTSENGHNLAGWSNAWVKPGWGGNYGGGSDDSSFRLLMGPGDGCGEGYQSAKLELNAGANYANQITFEHLDGSQTDSFDVYVNDKKVGHYAHISSGNEVWATSTFNFLPATGLIKVELIATEPQSDWCADWGQVAFSSVKIRGYRCYVQTCGENSAGWHKLNYVDIGNPVSEVYHSISGWSVANIPGNYGGCQNGAVCDYRQIVENPCDADQRTANIVMHAGENNITKLKVRHLDGISLNDSFEIWVGPTKIATWTDLTQVASEVWRETIFDVEQYDLSGDVTLTFKATDSIWDQCNTYGQVAIDWIEMWGCGEPWHPTIECGNGILEAGEQCDDGNKVDGDGCSANCTIEQSGPTCGDGIKNGSEECDDGNTVDTDACHNNCTLPAVCAFDLDVMMAMDRSGSMGYDNPTRMSQAQSAANGFLGELKSGDQSGLVSFANTATLDKMLSNNHSQTQAAVASLAPFGATDIGDAIALANGELTSVRINATATQIMILLTDGKANFPNGTGFGENPADVIYALSKANDAAVAGIKIFTIGLGTDINTAMLEQIASTTGGKYFFAPTAQDLDEIFTLLKPTICEDTYCGDGIKNGTEQCDGTDGVGEHQTCSTSCKVIELPYCGDGIKNQTSEQCDDGNAIDGDGCSANCTIEQSGPTCGDGIKSGSEQCDGTDGVGEHQTCSVNCTIINLPYCGDGIVNGTEQCDDANTNNEDQCKNDCTSPAVCEFDLDVAMVIDRSGSMSYTSRCDWWQFKCVNSPQCTYYAWQQNTDYNKSQSWCTAKNQSAPHNSVWTEYNPIKINAAKLEANDFLSLLGTNDQSALVSFANTATLDKMLSNNHAQTQAAVNNLFTYGATDIGDAIKLASGELVSTRMNPEASKIIILLTDGKANKPNGPGYGEYAADVAYALAKANEAAVAGIKIFTIGLGSDINSTMLQQIASSTGGQYYFAPTAQDLDDIFDLLKPDVCEEEPVCGDGIKNGTEQCDGTDGVGVHETCSANCTIIDLPYCGDGIVNGTEQCDDANTNNEDQCKNDCTSPSVCEFDLDVMMVMDRSGSMGYDSPTRMSQAKIAANNFLGNLKSSDQSGLVSFANTATLDKMLSSDHSQTQAAVTSLIPNGATNIGDAIKLANGEFVSTRANPEAAKIMILLTDGKANKPNGPGYGEYAADVAYALAKANEAAAAGIKIFTIGLGENINATMLQQIAASTGGQYYFAPTAQDLDAIFALISTGACQNLVMVSSPYQIPRSANMAIALPKYLI